MSFTYRLVDYLYEESMEAYHLFDHLISQLPNRDQFHFNDPIEKKYMDNLYYSLESYQNKPTLYRFARLLHVIFGDKNTAKDFTRHGVSRSKLEIMIQRMHVSHPLRDFMVSFLAIYKHNESLKQNQTEVSEKFPVKLRAKLADDELESVAKLPFRYNFWATSRNNTRKLDTMLTRQDFFERFALKNLGFSFAERDLGFEKGAQGWYFPSMHFLNIVPSSGDVKVTFLHEYVHAVDFGTLNLRQKNPELSQKWDALWQEGFNILWSPYYSPFGAGYKEHDIQKNFSEQDLHTVINILKAEKKDPLKSNLPPWLSWLLMDKFRFRKDYYALKEEIIARLGSMLLFVEYGRVQNEQGRVQHLLQNLYTNSGLSDAMMEEFQRKAVAWSEKFSQYILECNELDLSEKTYLNYLPLDLRPVLEKLTPITLHADAETLEKYNNYQDVIKKLLKGHGPIRLSAYFQAIKPFLSEKDYQSITQRHYNKSFENTPYLLGGNVPLLAMAWNIKPDVEVYSMEYAVDKAVCIGDPLPHYADEYVHSKKLVHDYISSEKLENSDEFLQFDGSGFYQLYFDNHTVKDRGAFDVSRQWLEHYYAIPLQGLKNALFKLQDPSLCQNSFNKVDTISCNFLIKVKKLFEKTVQKYSRTFRLEPAAASFSGSFSLFESQPETFVPNAMVDQSIDDFMLSDPHYYNDYLVVQGKISLLSNEALNTFVQEFAVYGEHVAFERFAKTHPGFIIDDKEYFVAELTGIIQRVEHFAEVIYSYDRRVFEDDDLPESDILMMLSEFEKLLDFEPHAAWKRTDVMQYIDNNLSM